MQRHPVNWVLALACGLVLGCGGGGGAVDILLTEDIGDNDEGVLGTCPEYTPWEGLCSGSLTCYYESSFDCGPDNNKDVCTCFNGRWGCVSPNCPFELGPDIQELPVEDVQEVDVPPNPCAPYPECTSPGECYTGFCIAHEDTFCCVDVCIDDCPPGFICSPVTTEGGDIVFICKPKEDVPPSCQTDEDCGPGFICTPVNLPGGNIISACIPEESVPSKCQTDDDCEDFNPCMDDWCNPETGACHHSDIDCDDGNPETHDFCISWGVDTPHCLNDWLCKEDGDLCTLPSPNACTPWPKTCDDGKPCTTDICDTETGDCINTPDECPPEAP